MDTCYFLFGPVALPWQCDAHFWWWLMGGAAVVFLVVVAIARMVNP